MSTDRKRRIDELEENNNLNAKISFDNFQTIFFTEDDIFPFPSDLKDKDKITEPHEGSNMSQDNIAAFTPTNVIEQQRIDCIKTYLQMHAAPLQELMVQFTNKYNLKLMGDIRRCLVLENLILKGDVDFCSNLQLDEIEKHKLPIAYRILNFYKLTELLQEKILKMDSAEAKNDLRRIVMMIQMNLTVLLYKNTDLTQSFAIIKNMQSLETAPYTGFSNRFFAPQTTTVTSTAATADAPVASITEDDLNRFRNKVNALIDCGEKFKFEKMCKDDHDFYLYLIGRPIEVQKNYNMYSVNPAYIARAKIQQVFKKAIALQVDKNIISDFLADDAIVNLLNDEEFVGSRTFLRFVSGAAASYYQDLIEGLIKSIREVEIAENLLKNIIEIIESKNDEMENELFTSKLESRISQLKLTRYAQYNGA